MFENNDCPVKEFQQHGDQPWVSESQLTNDTECLSSPGTLAGTQMSAAINHSPACSPSCSPFPRIKEACNQP